MGETILSRLPITNARLFVKRSDAGGRHIGHTELDKIAGLSNFIIAISFSKVTSL